MGLWRLSLAVDRRFLVAALGLAAAMVVPVAGVLATAGLQATVAPAGGWIALADDREAGLDLGAEASGAAPVWVLSGREEGGLAFVAFTAGSAAGLPGVQPGRAFDGGPAGRSIELGGRALVTVNATSAPVGAGVVLVHPGDLGAAPAIAARYSARPDLPGAHVELGRGSDAFEARGIEDLRDGSLVLVFASVPVVVLVAVALVRLETRRLSLWSGVLAALGHPRTAFRVIATRALGLAALGAALNLAVVAGAAATGALPGVGSDLPWRRVLLAVLVPTAAAAVAGALVGFAQARRAQESLRRAPALGDEPRVPGVPLRLRPWIAGWRILGVVAVVGMVLALDLGLPLAAAQVPAALAGNEGEWVVGPQEGRITAGRLPAAPAEVLADDPDVEAVIAETYVPTVVGGEPVLARGGDWAALASYHGLELEEGRPPRAGEVAVGEALARRLGLGLGDPVWLHGEDGRVGRATVQGVFSGPSLLEDEAVLPAADAQRLAGLQPGTVHALRARPDTPEVAEALGRRSADVRFTGLEVDPPEAPAGSIAVAHLHASNLGGAPGTRMAHLRINGESVATAPVALGAYGRAVVDLPFVVPPGEFLAQVNPEAVASGGEAPLAVDVPAVVVAGQPIAVHLAGPAAGARTVGLYGNLTAASAGSAPLAQATTDARGNATLPTSSARTGTLVVAVRPEGGEAGAAAAAAASVQVVAAADGSRARLVVEAAHLDPPSPAPGQPSALFLRVRNVGALAGARDLSVQVDGAQVDLVNVSLGGGEAGTFSSVYVPRSADATLTVDGVRVAGGTASGAAGPALPQPGHGGALQAQVADNLLGNARAVLSGLALLACTAALVLLVLGAQRILAQRTGVVAVLSTMWSDDQVRRRAALEAGLLGGIGGLAGILAGKALLARLAGWAGVHPFGHALADPLTPLVVAQMLSVLVLLASATLHSMTGRVLARRSWRGLEVLE